MTGQTQAQVNAKKAAINGHVDPSGCHAWYNAFGSNAKAGNYVQRFVVDNASGLIAPLSPQSTNNCQLPPALDGVFIGGHALFTNDKLPLSMIKNGVAHRKKL